MQELKQRHKGTYLSSITEKCIKDFDCELIQVISLTTDNGSNMKTLLKCLNDHLSKESIDNESDNADCTSSKQSETNEIEYGEDSTINEGYDYDNEIAHVLNEIDENDEAELDLLLYGDYTEEDEDWNFIDYSMNADLVQSMENIMNRQLFFVNGINCSAHTVQLAVMDALKLLTDENLNVISLARAVVKFIRKEGTRNESRNRGLKIILPALDIKTRWSSTYIMVRCYFY